jgi:hypothetical protein
MSHGAGRIGLEHRGECRLALLPPERVQYRHGPLEPLLGFGPAGDGKPHPAQAAGIVVVTRGLLGRRAWTDGRRGQHHGDEE